MMLVVTDWHLAHGQIDCQGQTWTFSIEFCDLIFQFGRDSPSFYTVCPERRFNHGKKKTFTDIWKLWRNHFPPAHHSLHNVHMFVYSNRSLMNALKRVLKGFTHRPRSESSIPPPALWFSIIIVSRCVAGWRQRAPLLTAAPGWIFLAHVCSLMNSLCVFVLYRPGFQRS